MKSPWAVILCKFKDSNEEPFPRQYYENLFTVNNVGSSWNMIRYFDDYSHGTLDLTDTQVFGWYHLDRSVADYNKLEGAARNELMKWAREAAAADGVDLSVFFNLVVCTNLWNDIGSASCVVAQGLTVIPRLLSHEMCHIYGLQHSRINGSTADYMDPWDIMSGAGDMSAFDPEFSSIGPGVNASNMRSRGWLDESRVWKNSAHDFDETITLRPHVRYDLPGFLAAEIWSGYLVEFRVREGWDGNITRPAVLIHRYEGDHSYLMPGNLGSSDLIAGDSFGDPAPDEEQVEALISSYQRVDVISINSSANEAILRIRRRRPPDIFGLAIDPMALILPGKAYLIWVELHHPHLPKIAEIQAILRRMSPEERASAFIRAKSLAGYGNIFEKAMDEIDKSN